MKDRKDIIKSQGHLLQNIQFNLYLEVKSYMDSEGMKYGLELSKSIGIPYQIINDLLKGEFNGTLEDLVKISLAIGLIPEIKYVKQ